MTKTMVPGFALCLLACGGAPFESALGTEAEPLDAGGDVLSSVLEHDDAAASADAADEPRMIRIDTGRPDASPAADAGDSAPEASSPPPARDAGVVDAPLDAAAAPEASSDGAGGGDSPVTPPDGTAPPALCCATPCGGAQVALITCGNGPAWTCDTAGGASCSAVRCAEGSLCHWQGASCVGTVEACP